MLFLCFLLSGCEAPLHPLRVGTNPWAGYLTFAYADDVGLLDPRQVRLLQFDSTQEVMRAFRNRAIDAAAVTLDEALLLSAHRQEPVIVLVFDASRGADVLLARPEVQSLADLKGRRVGVESNALGAYFLGRALEAGGLKPGDLHIVNLTPESHVRAYLQGRVDAVITFEPQRSQLLAKGARELFTSKQMPGEIVDVLVVRRNTLQEREEALQALVDAHFASLAELKREPAAVAARLSAELHVTSQELQAAWGLLDLYDRHENRELLATGSEALSGTLERLGTTLDQLGLLGRPLKEYPMLDDRLVREAGQ